MGRLRTIARRTFLFGSLAIAGGVAFGVWMVRKPHINPLLAGLPEGEASFNPWVRISADRITLIAPHADLGQGAAQMQAALIAEEMDLDPGQYVTDYGPPAAAYWNTALAAETGEALAAVTPMSAAVASAVAGSAIKVLGLQLTGGSTSTPDSFDKLRRAGAIARETLKRAAEAETGLPAAQLTTRSGAVVLPDGTALPYTALAARAATVEPVTEVTLRPPEDWRLIGKPVQRADILPKSTGTQAYGIDLTVEGMVHAAVRLSPRRSPVARFDDSAARALPGVTEVVPVTNGLAVLAQTTWHAMQGAAALEVDWEPAAYPAEQAGHWELLSQGIGKADLLNGTWRDDGDVDTALAGATVEAEYRAPYVAHQPLEPLNAIVRVTDTAAEVWTATQMPRFAQAIVAGIAGLPAEQVTLHNQHSGGSFGHRLEFEPIRLAAEIAVARKGTPVKLTFSREEDFAQDFPRHIALARGRAAHAGGQVTALAIDVAAPPVTASQLSRTGQPPMGGPDTQLSAGIWNTPYVLPSFRVRDYAVPGLAPVSSWRSVGASFGGFFLETLIDEAIHAAGADPVAERLRLIADPVARKVLETAAEMSGWGGALSPGKGRGVALVESFGVTVAEVVEVTDTPAGLRIDRVWVALDVGTIVDPVNFENQVQGGVVWGLGHAMNCEITYADGMAEQANFHAHEGMRLSQCPVIEVRGLQNSARVHGAGEPPVPPAAPALANAIFAATGTRLREMPFSRVVTFA